MPSTPSPADHLLLRDHFLACLRKEKAGAVELFWTRTHAGTRFSCPGDLGLGQAGDVPGQPAFSRFSSALSPRNCKDSVACLPACLGATVTAELAGYQVTSIPDQLSVRQTQGAACVDIISLRRPSEAPLAASLKIVGRKEGSMKRSGDKFSSARRYSGTDSAAEFCRFLPSTCAMTCRQQQQGQGQVS